MKTLKDRAVYVIEVPRAFGAEVVAALSGCSFMGVPPASWPIEVVREKDEGGGMKEELRDGLRVMFVRNPWSRVIAEIHAMQGRASGVFPYLEMKKNIRRFVEGAHECELSDLRSQVDFLKSSKSGMVDFVGRAECLEEDLEVVRELLELPEIVMPDTTKLERAGERYQDFFDEESREWVAELYADDVAAFGYDFELSTGVKGCSALQGEELGEALGRAEKVRKEHRDVGKGLAANYEGGGKWGWYQRGFHLWKRSFFSSGPKKVLEIGSGAGVSTCVLLDGIFPHPGSEVYCVDPLSEEGEGGDEGQDLEDLFWKNVERGGHSERVELFRGISGAVLAWMIAGEGYWESFDVIRVDGSPLARDVLADACKCFDLLKPGGRMIFGPFFGCGEAHPELAVEAFSQIYGSVMVRTRVGGLPVFEKKCLEVEKSKKARVALEAGD
jgi:predicted O-methyltransferase YrrM